ncbi:MAG: TolC family protein [Lentisphaerae bacterium]|nr:TolC family protein [Lentisphaerota bacterium]
MKISQQLLTAVIGMGVLVLAGCKSFDDYQAERLAKTVAHFEKAKYSNIPEGKVLTLNECFALARANNLDLKVAGLEEKVSKEMRTFEILGMLPELNISNNLNHRDNTPASSSRQLQGYGPGTYSYSQSQDRTVNYLNIDLALSVVDFGLAFFNTCQANDRMLLRQQYTRRAEQNLVLDTVRVYFQVAASQRAISITKKLLEECKNRYQLIEKMGAAGEITPFRAFDEAKRFVEMEKRLTNYIRSYENSCVELRSLLGLYPNAKIKVDDTLLDKIPDFTFPEMELMEQIALMKRPELFEIDMQKHINVLECRKTIVSMFPNVRMFIDFTNSNNSFLYHNSWIELGIRAAYNLLTLPRQISRYMAFSAQVDAEEYRSYAQAIAVMAQVRIAHGNLVATRERLDIDLRANNVYRKHLAKAEESSKISGELSQLELAHMRLATAETEIEKYLSIGNYYVSYYRVLNTLGIENLHKVTVDELKAKLASERSRAAEELAAAKAEFENSKKEKVAEKAPAAPVAKPAVKSPAAPVAKPAVKAPAAPVAKPAVKAPAAPAVKPAVKSPAAPAVKPAVKSPAAPAVKPAVKAPAVPVAKPAVKAPAAPVAKPAVKAPAAPVVKPAVKAPAVKVAEKASVKNDPNVPVIPVDPTVKSVK